MKNLKIHKYKLIKTYPTSPELGTILTFYEHQKVRYTMEGICRSYPEFWKDVNNGDVEEEVDRIFDESLYSIREGIGGEKEYELDTRLCKKRIVEYIKQMLNENQNTVS